MKHNSHPKTIEGQAAQEVDPETPVLASPHRVQLSRKAGAKLPPNTVVVSRPSKWGNPFRVGDGLHDTAQQCVDSYRRWMETGESYTHDDAPPDPSELRGKNLACWCKPGTACHADVLLRLANAPIQPHEGRAGHG